MSVLVGETELRDHLMTKSEDYRRLAVEHQSYEEKLIQLKRRLHLSEEEKIQEITFKKKKLMLKDQMYAMLQKYRKEIESGK